jgi:hypothetical protein
MLFKPRKLCELRLAQLFGFHTSVLRRLLMLTSSSMRRFSPHRLRIYAIRADRMQLWAKPVDGI